MKIQGYKIGNQVIGYDIFTWGASDLNNNDPFICSDVIGTLYSDISSINTWYDFGYSVGEDYIFIREQISLLVNQIGFSNLTQDEKVITSKLFLTSKNNRDTVLSEDDQRLSWNQLVNDSLNCRSDRWVKAKSYISYNLSSIDSSDLALNTSELCQNFVNYNITSNSICGKDGLYDFIQGSSSYSMNGFPSKTYWTQSYQDEIMSILTTGK